MKFFDFQSAITSNRRSDPLARARAGYDRGRGAMVSKTIRARLAPYSRWTPAGLFLAAGSLGLALLLLGCTPDNPGESEKLPAGPSQSKSSSASDVESDREASGTTPAGPPSQTSGGRDAGQDRVPAFSDATEEVGIDFLHFNGMSGEFYFCESVGAGAGWLDYDGDGDLDLYLVQGAMLGDKPVEASSSPLPDGPLTDRLLRNEWVETGALKFTDVTDAAKISVAGYGMGVSVGDYDADGDPDIYVTNFGPNVLLRNNGDGTFSDQTASAGVEDNRWNTSSAFFDFDRDGHLDLFVCAYVRFTLAANKECYSETSARDYCGPLSFPPFPDRLFRNRGDGTFEDVTAVSRIALEYGAGLGVVCSDFNEDGWPDIFVSNDGLPNECWMNQGDGTFINEALLAGCAYNKDGVAEASMGVDAADFDGDGDEDLFMTHLDGETNTLYRNEGNGLFEDVTNEFGLALPSQNFTGFGTAWIDFDNDSWLDLLIVNGAVKSIESLARQGDPYPLHQTNQLFRNEGGRFRDVTANQGPAFERSEVSRGAAFGDVDNDGDIDVLIVNNRGRAQFLRNEVGSQAPWIQIDLRDHNGKRPALGSRLEVQFEDGSSLFRSVRRAGSYCSSNDPRVLFGLKGRPAIVKIVAHAPDRSAESWDALPPGQAHRLTLGTGTPLPARTTPQRKSQ